MSSDDLESPPSNYLPIPPSDEFHDQPPPLRSWLRLLSIPLALMFLLVLATFLSNLESPPTDSGLVSDPVTFDVNPAVVRRGKDAGVSDKTSGADSGFTSEPVTVDANTVIARRGKDAGVSDKTSGVDSGLLKDGPLGPYPWTNQMLSWQRTGFHFQPVKNWMNDPNGPLYYKGWYHFFYQYNPEGAVWGNIAWGHAVSRDLVHWTHLPLAMVPDQWYDINGVWTGSATILPDGQIVMLYTGATNESVQVQNLAVPADKSDTLLLRWKKSEANPILVPPPGVGDKDFRDPTTAWYEPSDDTWRIVIGSKDSSHSGIAIVYSTKDFISYKLIPGILHAVERVGMWECVDFYPVATADSSHANHGLDPSVRPGPAVKHVMKASMDDDRHDYYAIGTYDPAQNTWVPDDASVDVGIGLRYDWGKFYASKTFYDHAKKRRILWSWIGETDSETADIAKGWASLQGVPRTVLLDLKTGSNLITWPVVEIESLRTRPRDFSGITVDAGSTFKLDVGGAAQLDIEAEFRISSEELEAVKEADVSYNCSSSGGAAERGVLGPFGLLVLANQDLTEQTATYFYVSRGLDGGLNTHFCQDEKRSSKASDIVKRIVGHSVPVLDGESFTLRILVDHSIVESFAQGGRASATSRVYPTEAIYNNARVFVFNNATGAKVTAQSLKVWHMSSAINEIYDPATNMM